MNLLYTITSYPPAIGGAQLYFHHLAKALSKEHVVQVATHWDTNRVDWLLGTTLRASSISRRYCVDGIPVYQMGISAPAKVRALLGLASYPLAQRRAVAWLSAALVDQLGLMARGSDVIHNNRIGREPISYASFQLARRLGIPFVFTPNHHPRWVGWWYEVYLDLYRQADALIALTRAERDTYVALGVDPARVHVVGASGFLADTAHPRAFRDRYQINGNIVLFVGQKFEYKGLDRILAAAPKVWARHPDTHFVFIGPRTPYSVGLFSRPQDSRILELGSIGPQEKTDAMAACDIYCMPSTQESFGQVFVEAWTLGKPVIGADIPAERELIGDGVDGFVVRPGTDELTNRIVTLLDSPDMRARMGQAGHEKAVTEFSMERIAARTTDAYEAAIRNVRSTKGRIGYRAASARALA